MSTKLTIKTKHIDEIVINHKIGNHIIEGIYEKTEQKIKYKGQKYSSSEFITYHFEILPQNVSYGCPSEKGNEWKYIKYINIHGISKPINDFR